MLLKYFSVTGCHGEPGGLDYLLDNPTARVVRGSVEFTKWVIDHSPPGLRQRFSAGVINDLAGLDRRHDDRLLDELQELILAGRPESAMVWCVIEHTDKCKRELHFVIVIFDLLFAKLVHPFIDRIDRHGFAAWAEHFALRHGLGITSEKLRVRPPFEHLRIRRCDVAFLLEVWEKVHGWVGAGEVNCRRDLKVRLALEGYQVRCHTRKGKPLQQPQIVGPDGKSLRLKNSIYYRADFGLPRAEPIDRADPQAVKARLAELRQIIQNRMEFRAHHLAGRLFGVREQRLVAKGKARQRLMELIARKLEVERIADRPWRRIDLAHAWQAAALFRSGVGEPIGGTRKKSVAEPQMAKHVSLKDAEDAPNSVVEPPASPIKTAAAPGGAITEPEAFQPPPSGEIPGTGTPPQAPPQTPATPAASRVSKRKRPRFEIGEIPI
jgi:hypothetical protein